MKYDKLVVISTYTLDRRTNTLFGIRDLVKMGVEVEYWDVGPLTYNIILGEDPVDGVKVVHFDNKAFFRKYIKETANKQTLYLVFMTYAPKSFFCYRELSKYDLDLAYCVNGLIPSLLTNNNLLGRIKDKSKLLFNLNVWESRLYKLLWWTPLLKPLTIQFNSARLAAPRYKVDKNTQFVSFNSSDFIQSLKADAKIIDYPYIAFIDQYLPKHPDNAVMGFKDLDEQLYYRQLNKLFDLLEKKYDCKVVIAAHPVAQCYKDCNPFNGRDIFYYKTHTLTKYSIGVISHNTTAYSFAIVYNKPAIVITSDEMHANMPIITDSCKMFAQRLNWPLVNIDHLNDKICFNEINKSLYDSYKYDYLTNLDAENKSNAEILYSVMKGY